MAHLRFAVASEDAGFGATVAEQLASTGHVEVSSIISDPDELLEALASGRPDGVLADLGSDPEYLLDVLGRIPAPRPVLLVVGRTSESELILRAMRLGAKEFFPRAPSQEELRDAVERLVLDYRPEPSEATLRRAPVVAVMGAKGGVGATVVACQLAAGLQKSGARTALVDLNLPLGDVALHFDVQPRYTIANLARETELDDLSLATILQGHRSGVQILAAPTQMEEAELVGGDHVESALSLLRHEFDWIVLDVSRSWSDASVRALDLADQIVLVTLHDVPTLNHARAHLDLLKRLGHSDSKIRIVANRFATTDAVTARDFVQFLGRAPDLRLPNDYPTTFAAVNEGKPVGLIAPRSALHKAYLELTLKLHDWCGLPRPQSEGEPGAMDRVRGLLARITRKGNDGTA
ncbi:MAG: cellulose synthase operon protein YhjQ/BcsQ [Myxococcota bacterium]